MGEITERRAPHAILLRCSCGWTFQVSRRQNALARAAKVKAAVRAHWNVCPIEGVGDKAVDTRK